MRKLTTQLPPNSGEAYVLGRNTIRDSASVRGLIVYVPQETSVWGDISGYENLLIYAKTYGIPTEVRGKLMAEALENIGLSEVANKLVKSYSGGMIRRLEIASALLVSPKILFLDEPTIGLDPMARKVVWEKLITFKKEYGTTVFFNTHYMNEANIYADQLGIISRGRIITTGTIDDLKNSVGDEALILDLEENRVGVPILEEIRAIASVKDAILSDSELIMMPLFFASNALYPVEIMPPVLRELSLVNPLSYVVDVVRSLMITGDVAKIPADLFAITIFDIVMFIVASISFKRIIE